MPTSSPHDVTRLLEALDEGEQGAWEALLPVVYDELHRLARAQRRRRKPYETLNTTALVHEAYLKLVDGQRASWQDRMHFYRVAGRVMRGIMVDYARQQQAQKRGGTAVPVPLDAIGEVAVVRVDEVLGLHDALDRLQAIDERQAQIVELRYFVGLTIPEAADVLDLSPATVKRDWTAARAWLYREMQGGTGR